MKYFFEQSLDSDYEGKVRKIAGRFAIYISVLLIFHEADSNILLRAVTVEISRLTLINFKTKYAVL